MCIEYLSRLQLWCSFRSIYKNNKYRDQRTWMTYYETPIDWNNAEASNLVLVTPMFRFDLTHLDGRFESHYAAEIYLFSNSSDRYEVNTDQHCLFHPPYSEQIYVPSIPQISGSNIYGVNYIIWCSLNHIYKINFGSGMETVRWWYRRVHCEYKDNYRKFTVDYIGWTVEKRYF